MNCGYEAKKEIEKGVPANGYHLCPNCGCVQARLYPLNKFLGVEFL